MASTTPRRAQSLEVRRQAAELAASRQHPEHRNNYESVRLGEQVALGILEEQKLTYGETFSMTVPLFDGGAVRI